MSWLSVWRGFGDVATKTGVLRLFLASGEEARERSGCAPIGASRAPIWLHAASVGEVAAAGSLLRALRGDSSHPIALSTTTSTGRSRAAALAPDLGPFVAPWDAPGPVRSALDRLTPSSFIAVETELWPTLLDELNRRGLPWGVASARLSARGHARMRRVRGLYTAVLRDVRAIAARSDEDAARFCDLGAPAARVAVLGDLKEDREMLEWSPPSAPVPAWIAACTRPGEEALVLQAAHTVAARVPRGELVLAPRHPDRFEEAAELVRATRMPLRRWRERADAIGDGWSVLLVDEMGVLDEAYRRASCAFVGGSLAPFGGHSPWEAAAAGRAVLMGPHVETCRAAFDTLQAAGAAETVTSAEDLAVRVLAHLESPEHAERGGRRAQAVLVRRGGVARATVEFLRAQGVVS